MTPLFILTLALAADDKAPTPLLPAKLERKEPVDYAKEIAPIMAAKCNSCHSGWVAKGMVYTGNYASLVAGNNKKGPGIVPGKPNESRVYLLSSHQKKPIMPPESEAVELTDKELALLKLWIEQGAKGPKEEVKPIRKVSLALPPALVKPVRALAIHGTTLAVGRANKVHLLDAKTGTVTGTLVDPNIKTPDGKPADASHVSLVESMAFNSDGTLLATGSFREVTIWNLEKKTVEARLAGFADKVTAVAWSADGKYFATAGGAPTEDGEIKLYDTDGKLLLEFRNPHSDTVFGLAFSPDSKLLASASADKFARVFEVPSGKLVKSFEGHTQHVLDVGWSTDGKRLISAGADDLIKFWDYESGEKKRDLRGTSKQVMKLAFAGKTPVLFSAGGDAVVRRWNLETGDPSRTFGESKDCLHAVAATADGSYVAAGGEEGLVRIFDTKTGALVKAVAFEK